MIVKIRVQRGGFGPTRRGGVVDYIYQQYSGVRFRVSGVSNRIQPAMSESLMKWTLFHRCWSSVAIKSAFRFQDSTFTDT